MSNDVMQTMTILRYRIQIPCQTPHQDQLHVNGLPLSFLYIVSLCFIWFTIQCDLPSQCTVVKISAAAITQIVKFQESVY